MSGSTKLNAYYFVMSLLLWEFLSAGSQLRVLLKQLYGLILVNPDKRVSLPKSCLSQAVLSCPRWSFQAPRKPQGLFHAQTVSRSVSFIVNVPTCSASAWANCSGPGNIDWLASKESCSRLWLLLWVVISFSWGVAPHWSKANWL